MNPDQSAESIVRLLSNSLTFGIRTPLHSLLGFGELLVMAGLDESQRQLAEQVISGAEEVLSACNRIGALLGVLATRASGSTAAEPAARSFDLPELLGEVTAVVSTTTSVGVQIDPRIPTSLVGDRDALVDALSELVTNAVAHGRPPFAIAVERAGHSGPEGLPVRFSVTDAGPGLPAHVWAGLHSARPTPPEDGRHFGLYLARLLADRLGGRLTATRGSAGGTAVTLSAPLRPADSAVPGAAVRAVASRMGLRVLLVEDNTVNRILAQRQFARLGHALDTVTTGAAGIAAAIQGDYDVVLMDRHLPDIDGIETTRRIRAAEEQLAVPRRVRVIAVTADVSSGTQEECLAAGMDGFLSKPVDLERLRAALATVTPGADAPAPPTEITAPATPLPTQVEVDVAVVTRLTEELDGDRSAAMGLLRAYLTELPGRRLRLQGAIRRSNTRQTVAAADSLRSASITVGAVRVARACTRIGVAAETGDLLACHNLLPELLEACEKANAMLGRMVSVPEPVSS
ncbi:response regulator [Cryptosporangium aurantiacum]|uniref:CheY chemotaxis protein or a CheY-like REC (Receiver) domain n=1 Tax=Cryptosporangium aurantiacum TaxID=134849 RepID=A0A1M7K2V2_9ACTN|nr:response regulator [Cryptosporangium aurantiacum]SHM59652.1 CheY chemotaxis protein or a CheY-like REC (receiver) domain [Cryptosporangium aurantiacum]